MRQSKTETLVSMARLVILASVFAMLSMYATGQTVGEQISLPLISDYDLDSATYTYCVTLGKDGNPLGTPFENPGVRVVTSGSSTTVTGLVATSGPFLGGAAGDEVTFTYGGVQYRRYIVTFTSADSIVVNAAVNFATPGARATWKRRSCGTTATSGWFPVHGLSSGTLVYQIDQLDVTGGIDFKFECRQYGAVSAPAIFTESTPGTKGAANHTTTGNHVVAWSYVQFDECRLGMKIGTADDGADTTTHTEKITAYVTAWR